MVLASAIGVVGFRLRMVTELVWPTPLPLTVQFFSATVPLRLITPLAWNPPGETFPVMVQLVSVVVVLRLNTPAPPVPFPMSRVLPETVQLVRVAAAFWLAKPPPR